MTGTKKTHYHVMFGQHGCMPDSNETYPNMQQAMGALQETKWNAVSAGYTVISGNLKGRIYEFDRNCYADIEECSMPDCEEIEVT